MTSENNTLPAAPPILPITADDLRRHFIRHLYAISTSLDPRILLDLLQVGEDQFLLSDLSEDARQLCTTMSQSLQDVDARLLADGPSTNTFNRGYRKYIMLSTDINVAAKHDNWFRDASISSQKVASEVLRYFSRCMQLLQQTAVEGVELYPIGDDEEQRLQGASASNPPSPANDSNIDLFDLLFDVSSPLPQPPPGVTWVNSCVSARKVTTHRLFTLTTAQRPFELHVQLYNTNDIEGVPERDKPFYTAVAANLHLPTSSPVLKILDALFITAAEEILADGGHCFTAEY